MLMAFETFYRKNKFTKRLYAQFSLIRSMMIRFRGSYRDQQASSTQIFNFVGWREIATAMSHAPDYAERSSVERMARILNLDQFHRGFIRLTRGDIPEGLRTTPRTARATSA